MKAKYAGPARLPNALNAHKGQRSNFMSMKYMDSGYPLCFFALLSGILRSQIGARADRICINIRDHEISQSKVRRFT